MAKMFITLVQSKKQAELGFSGSIIPVLAEKLVRFKSRNTVNVQGSLKPFIGKNILADVTESQVTYKTKQGNSVTEWQLRVNVLDVPEVVVNKVCNSLELADVSFAATPAANQPVDEQPVNADASLEDEG